ncbi:DUF423 domain-containing protein [Paenibacillus sp. NFR01]|uniref:DUF423 domain-containing protein n=1 Tax=Paenibacillus sp. NFR01 TaxID=1566279 RepID=UPI0008CB747C|nr:DUF423 domain-containing protein [Paenibacillus sp. NFR01]SES91234.1 Uncharacterized membrane protein YgdD, TMEM256/DUF423 family [Paenibacillus sp. NFR01]
MQRRLMAWGAILAMLSVAFGAFGAHMLKDAISEEDLQVYQTGVHYHMIHALGLILIALVIGQWGESPRLKWAGRLLCLGIILFSGSLYALSLSGISVLGAITPLGGVCFLAGWLCLAWEALSRGQKA